MDRSRNLLSILISCLCLWGVHAQQLPLYTQYMYNKLAYNPGYAGGEDALQVTAHYRNQWIGLEGAPKVFVVSAHGRALGPSSALGLQIQSHSIGISDFTMIQGVYAYNLEFENGASLGIGASAMMRMLRTDYGDDRLQGSTSVGADPSISDGVITQWQPNFGLGLYYTQDRLYLSLSSPRLIKQDLQFEMEDLLDTREVAHYMAMAGYSFELSEQTQMLAQGALRITEDAPLDADLSGILRWREKIDLGLNYRFGGRDGAGDSIDFIAGWQALDQLKIAVSYDMSFGQLRQVQDGSLEILLQYRSLSSPSGEEQLVNPRIF